jgi:hypothetical protein
MQEVTEEELSECISTFKNGKAQDESKITIEHLKYGGNYQFSMCLEFLHFEKLCLLILSI